MNVPVASKRDLALVTLALAFTTHGAGCRTDSPPPPDQDPTGTDGVITTGVEEGGGDGLDDTAADPPYYCIANDNNPMNLEGVKHQCNLEYELTVSFTITPLAGGGGPDVPVSVQTPTVVTVNDSTYEHPFVAVCCTDVTDHPDWEFEDSCLYEHHKWCMSDFLDHVCLAPGNWLEAMASDFLGQGQQAIEEASEWLEQNRQACYDHFWEGPDDLLNADYCDPTFDDFFNHTPWEPNTSFIYSVFGNPLFEVSNIVVSPRSNFGEHVPVAPPNPAETCEGPIENDGAAPPMLSPGSTGSFFSPTAPVAIDVVGPQYNAETISGSGDFGTASVLQWYTNGSGQLEIEYWKMTKHAATTVGTTSMTVGVSDFGLATVRRLVAPAVSGGWKLGAGTVVFDLAAVVDGASDSVRASNSSAIEFHTISGGTGSCPAGVACLVSSPFTISYVDALNDAWTADVASATWRP